MPYNPGITARGELMGQGLGAGLSSMAQSYGQGLQLREEQKRYDDLMKQRRRDRKNLKKSYGMQAELLGVDKEDIDTMGLGELQGFVEGTKLKSSLDYQGVQLQRMQEDIEQTAAGKRAVGQMQMYIEEQNLSPVDAATNAARDEGLELGEAAKLLNLATTGQKLGLELQQLQISGRIADVQQRQVARGEAADKRLDQPTKVEVLKEGGRIYHKIGTRTFEVDDEGREIPELGPEGAKITTKVDSIIGHLDEAVGGDDRYWLNIWSRQSKASTLIKEIGSKNREYRLKNGQDHPDYIRLKKRAAPFINKMKNSSDETNRKLAKKLAEELEIKID